MYKISLSNIPKLSRTKIVLFIACVTLASGGTASYVIASNSSRALEKQLTQQHSFSAAANPVSSSKVKFGVDSNSRGTVSPSSDSVTSTQTDKPASSPQTSQVYKTYTNSQGNQIESPDNSLVGATATCADGTYSHSVTASGTCSAHGGIYNTPSSATLATPSPIICDSVSQQTYVNGYNISVNNEDSDYQNQLALAQQQSSSQLGGMSSGLTTNQTNQITYQHQQNLSSLLGNLNSQLISINCPAK